MLAVAKRIAVAGKLGNLPKQVGMASSSDAKPSSSKSAAPSSSSKKSPNQEIVDILEGECATHRPRLLHC